MFKSWNIRSLLQLWSIVAIVSVIALAIISVYSNQKYESAQQRFINEVLPLENASREISQTIASFVTRQKQIIFSDTKLALDKVSPRIEWEQKFEDNWQKVSQIYPYTGHGEEQVDALLNHYQELLIIDSRLDVLAAQRIDTSTQMRDQIEKAEKLYIEFQNMLESIVGRITLKAVINKRNNLNPLAQSQIDANVTQLKELSQSSRLHALKIVNLAQAVTQAENSDVLLSIKENDIKQYQDLIKEDVMDLREQLKSNPGLLRNVEQLETLFQDLMTLMIGDDSLYSLRSQQIEIEAKLKVGLRAAISTFDEIMSDIVSISAIVNTYSDEIVAESRKAAKQIKWLIVLISFLVFFVIVYFVLSISQRITRPLNDLRRAMASLSSQNYDIRLVETEDKSEFAALAHDFNTFAENNQRLINDLASAKDSIESREQQISAIINGVPEAILTLSSDGVILSTNPEALRVLNAQENSLEGLNITRFFDESEQISHMVDIANLLKEGQEFLGSDFNDNRFSMWLSLNPISSLNNDVWVCVISDITARKKAEQDLVKTSIELDTILENAMVGIAFIRGETILRVNHKFETLFACEREEIEGKSISQIYPSEEAFRQMESQANDVLLSGDNYEGEMQLLRRNGEKFWCSLSSKAIDPDNLEIGSICLYEDVTLQRENDEKLRKLASIDVLTDLPNRSVFNDRLEHAVHKANRNGSRLAVFFLDLDHFKHVNDSLGHKAGDLLLCQVSERLKNSIRSGDTVARLGGDEFTIILEEIRSAQYVAKVAEKVTQTISRSYMLDGTEVNISPSIGISLYPADGREVDTLIKNADAAMYHAKKNGRNNFQFYSAEMNASATERLAMETSLRRALELEEFELQFQPQIDLQTKSIAGNRSIIALE